MQIEEETYSGMDEVSPTPQLEKKRSSVVESGMTSSSMSNQPKWKRRIIQGKKKPKHNLIMQQFMTASVEVK